LVEVLLARRLQAESVQVKQKAPESAELQVASPAELPVPVARRAQVQVRELVLVLVPALV
jgi:hypothetical protein